MTIENNDLTFKPARRRFLTATAAGTAAAVVVPADAGQAAAAEKMIPQEKLGVPTEEVDVGSLPRVKQKLVPPPATPLHEQVATTGPKIVEVEMTVEEKQIEIDDDGTKIWAFTYNGTVPGPMIVCHQGDYVELTLKSSPDNQLEHNIDFHAATGALGGAELTHIQPGEYVVLRFRALKAGVFVYHCAPGAEMVPYHVLHGMNGAIMVLPRDGLKDRQGEPIKYDKAFFVGEQDFYIPRDENGEFVAYENAIADYTDSLDAMRTLTPTHIVFNGRVGALTGDAAMKAAVGETVLIVHAQCSRDTRPHLIGGHGDYVWQSGSFEDRPDTDLETWFIRGGSAGAAVYTFRQPGTYAYLNHNLIESFLLGAVAEFAVEGDWNDKLMTQVVEPQSFS